MTEYFLITTIFDGKIDIDRKTPFTEQIEENNSFMNIERNWDKSIIPQMNDFIEKNGKKLNDIT